MKKWIAAAAAAAMVGCSGYSLNRDLGGLCDDVCQTMKEIEEIYATGDTTGIGEARAILGKALAVGTEGAN